MSPSRPRAFGSKLASLGFGALTVCMVALTVSITWTFGATLALSDWDKLIQSLASVSVDLMGFMIAFAIGLLWKWRQRAGAFLLCLPLVFYVGYSMQSVIGFGSVARIAKDQKVKAEAREEQRATQEANAFAAQTKLDTIEWMKNTAYKRAQRKERGSILEAIREEANKPVEVKAPKSVGTMGDPQAEVLAGMLAKWDVTPQDIQMGQVIWLSILLVLGKALGSFCTGFFWPTRGGRLEPTAALPAAPARPATEPPPPGRSFRLPEKSDDDALVASVRADADVAQEATWWRQVERFRREATYLDPGAAPLTSTDIYLHFVRWAQFTGQPEPLMSHNRFGRISTAMHAHKGDGDARRMWTAGVGLVPLPDADADAEVVQVKAA